MSDLHVGARDDPVVEHGLGSLVERVEPELIVASGDLTHRGRRAQHEQAAAILRSLGPPVLAVPGNHDIPYSFPARLTTPWQEFERQWQTTEPVHEAEGALVVGLNSVRPWHHQSGGVTTAQLDRAAGAAARRGTRLAAHGRPPPPAGRPAVADAQARAGTTGHRARSARRARVPS